MAGGFLSEKLGHQGVALLAGAIMFLPCLVNQIYLPAATRPGTGFPFFWTAQQFLPLVNQTDLPAARPVTALHRHLFASDHMTTGQPFLLVNVTPARLA